MKLRKEENLAVGNLNLQDPIEKEDPLEDKNTNEKQNLDDQKKKVIINLDLKDIKSRSHKTKSSYSRSSNQR